MRFYKKLKLDPAEPGSLKSWYISDGSGVSILKDAIPFKYDPVNSSYRNFVIEGRLLALLLLISKFNNILIQHFGYLIINQIFRVLW